MLASPAWSAESDQAHAERMAALEELVARDTKAAMTAVQQALADASELTPGQRAELQAVECVLVLNERPQAALSLAETALRQPDLPTLPRVRLQVCQGQALDWTGQPGPARTAFEAALTAARQDATDPLLILDPLIALGALDTYQGRFLEAAKLLREAQAALDAGQARLLPAPQGQIDTAMARRLRGLQQSLWQQFGTLYASMEDGDKAMGYFQRILADVEAQKEMAGQILAHYNIGRAFEELGRFDEAIASQQRSLELAQAAGDEVSVAWAQRSIGAVLLAQDRFGEAKPYVDAAMVAFQTIADVEIIAQLHYFRARIHRAEGRKGAAEADLRAAIATFRQNQTLRTLDKALIELAELREQDGALAEALALRREREDIHRKVDKEIQDKTAARIQAEFDNDVQQRENQRLAELKDWQAKQLADADKLAHQQYLIIVLGAIIAAAVLFFAVRQLRISARMKQIALTDELTQVPNRRSIYYWAGERWQAADGSLAVIVLDIDFFKKINDRFGHAMGDRVLQAVAQCCQNQLRQLDRIGRVGGEEFMVVLPGAPIGPALEVAERLRQAVLALPTADWAPGLQVSISLGVAERIPADNNLAALIQRADNALYRAKAGGRNRVESATETV